MTGILFLVVRKEERVKLSALGKKIHRILSRNANVLSRKEIASEQRVLKYTNDTFVEGWADDLILDGRQVFELHLGLVVLRHVHVHFISVKVCVVRLRVGHVHAKGITLFHNLDPMCHHGHSVQRRLTIEQYIIAIHHVSMHRIPVLKLNVGPVMITKGDVFAVREFQNFGTRVNIRTIFHEIHQELLVSVRDKDGLGQIHGNLQRNTQVHDRQLWVGCNDRTSTVIDTLSHQVSADTTGLSLVTLGNRLECTS